MSRFNLDVCEGLLGACADELRKHQVQAANMLLVSVPGALAIPLTLVKLASSGRFDALIALGAVIRGETYHFELVCNESAAGLTRVQLDTGIPVANGIFTPTVEGEAVAPLH